MKTAVAKFLILFIGTALAAGLGVEYIRSWWRSDAVCLLSPPTGQAQAIVSHRGRVYLLMSYAPIDDQGWRVLACSAAVDQIEKQVGTWYVADRSSPSIDFVVRIEQGRKRIDASIGNRWKLFSIPHWLPLAPLLLLTSLLWRREIRRWAWKRHGCCAECGYDLRHSPEGCPECGAGRQNPPAVASVAPLA